MSNLLRFLKKNTLEINYIFLCFWILIVFLNLLSNQSFTYRLIVPILFIVLTISNITKIKIKKKPKINDFRFFFYPIRNPFSTRISEVSKTISFSSPTEPNTKHSLIKSAICFLGKLTTAIICFPIKSSLV